MLVNHNKVKSIIKKKLLEFGVRKADAIIVSKSLVLSDLKGHSSHGILRSIDYLKKIKEKKINLNPKISVKYENSIAKIDGDWGFGQIVMIKASNVLARLLKKNNIACVTVKNCNHIGRLSDYTEAVAANKAISICFSNLHGTSHIVSPFNGVDRKLPSNPICISSPLKNGFFSCDFATSSLAEGKVKLKYIDGLNIAKGHLIDYYGKVINNPKKFYEGLKGSILPFGGLNAHKGYALSLAIDILAGTLSGAGCSSDLNNKRHGNAVTMIGINIKKFIKFNKYLAEIKKLENHVKSSRKLKKGSKILFPGEPEKENLKKNKKIGIYLSKNLLKIIQNFD